MNIDKLKKFLVKDTPKETIVESEEQSRDDEPKFHAEARAKIENMFILGLKKLRFPDEDLIEVQEKYQGFKQETFEKFSEISKEIEAELAEKQPKTLKQKVTIGISTGWSKTKDFVGSKLPKKSNP